MARFFLGGIGALPIVRAGGKRDIVVHGTSVTLRPRLQRRPQQGMQAWVFASAPTARPGGSGGMNRRELIRCLAAQRWHGRSLAVRSSGR
jgi:hypothetical protein